MAANTEQSAIPSFEDARHLVEEQATLVHACATESAALLDAAGRVLAESVLADRDIPPFPRSTRDGYAVRAADLATIPTTLKVIGEIKAGAKQEEIPANISSGQAASIMTGAPMPAGADAVVMVEYTSTHGERVEIMRGAAAGENVVPRGAEARQDSFLLDCGQRLNDAAIALAASVGKSRLKVFQRPRVAVLTTGDEIVAVCSTPRPTQIPNSNRYSPSCSSSHTGREPVLPSARPPYPPTP